MPQKRRKSAYAWLWVLALAALSAAISITHYKIGDSDYYWHCMYGQILATTHKMPATDPVSWLAAESGLHYIDYSWFCDLLLYKLSLLGPIETYGGLLFFLLFSIPVTILIFGLSSMTNHCLEVGIVCAWLRATRKLHFSEMLLDMQLRESQAVGEHRPDIVVGNLAIEVELNHKRKETLTRNVLSNELTYDGQVWLVPQRKSNIRRSLAEIFADNVIDETAKILCLEDIHQELSLCNIHNNTWQAPPLP